MILRSTQLTSPGNAEQFKQSFKEEAREVLVDLESALLELNENREDPELVGRVFRGLHTIKGSGSMFGFEDLAAFTHDLETAFDEVRNGRLAITAALVDLTLAALDQIRNLLEEISDDRDAPAREAILGKVRKLAGIRPQADKSNAVATPAAATLAPAAEGAMRHWSIHFAPGPEFLLNGSNPLLLLAELRQLGGLSVQADMAAIPPLADLDAERCYVAWEGVLATAAGRDAIRDVFIFAEDCCELAIDALPAGDDGSAAEHEAIVHGLEEPRATSGGRRTYDKPDSATSLRVPAAKLDQFVDLVGELVTVQARLAELAARRDDIEVAQVSEEIERLTAACGKTR